RDVIGAGATSAPFRPRTCRFRATSVVAAHPPTRETLPSRLPRIRDVSCGEQASAVTPLLTARSWCGGVPGLRLHSTTDSSRSRVVNRFLEVQATLSRGDENMP